MTEQIIDVEPTEELTEAVEQPQPVTVEQSLKDLLAWLKERNLQIVPCAMALRNGRPIDIEGFLPTTHVADWSLQEIQK